MPLPLFALYFASNAPVIATTSQIYIYSFGGVLLGCLSTITGYTIYFKTQTSESTHDIERLAQQNEALSKILLKSKAHISIEQTDELITEKLKDITTTNNELIEKVDILSNEIAKLNDHERINHFFNDNEKLKKLVLQQHEIIKTLSQFHPDYDSLKNILSYGSVHV